MTPEQRRCLDAIEAHWRTHRCGPTLAELAAAIGSKSKSNAHRLTGLLLRQGALERVPGAGARNLRPRAPAAAGVNARLLAAARRVHQEIIDEHVVDGDPVSVTVDADAFAELDLVLTELEQLGRIEEPNGPLLRASRSVGGPVPRSPTDGRA